MPAKRRLLGIAGAAMLLLSSLAVAPARAYPDVQHAAQFLTGRSELYAQDLLDLVSIPSVSSLPRHASDVLLAAEWLSNRLVGAGLHGVKIIPTEGVC